MTATMVENRTALYADLERRADNAMQIAEQAQDAGDEPRLYKAMERYYFRLAQLIRLQQMPADARCPICTFGEDEPWPADFWTAQPPYAFCLEHSTTLDQWWADEKMADFNRVVTA